MDIVLGYVATGLVSLIVGYLLSHLEPRARIGYWFPHSSYFFLEEHDISIQTGTLTVQNLGRKKAEDVQLVFSQRPDFFQITPPLPYSEEESTDGNYVIGFSMLGPKEVVSLQILGFTQFPALMNLRSSAGSAESVQIQMQRVYPQWLNMTALALMLVGLAAIIYLLIRLGIYVTQII